MSLDALEAMAAETVATDAEVGPVQLAGGELVDAPAQASAETQAREWGSIAFAVGSALSIMAPELRAVYTEDACFAWGAAMVPVAEKHGWNGPGGSPEIALALSSLGLIVPTALVLRAKIAQAKQQAEAQQHQAQQQVTQQPRAAAPAGPAPYVPAPGVESNGLG